MRGVREHNHEAEQKKDHHSDINFCLLLKGHRSSNCNHVERPLLEVRKKGRPVSQCAYCRDLRKTRQIHAKCACSSKNKGKYIHYAQKRVSLYLDISILTKSIRQFPFAYNNPEQQQQH